MNIKIINEVPNPAISLIIPVYMEEKILQDILSHYNRDLLKKYNTEIIISDGGSSDSTVNIAENFADKIIIHTEQRRQTIAEGRNAGASIADGEVFVFINGDTYPENPDEFLKFIYNWSIGQSQFNDCGALATRVYVSKSDELFSDVLFYNIFNTYVRLLNVIGIGMCRGECQIVRKDIFKSINGYNAKLAAGEDFDLFNRIIKIAKTKYTSAITVIESPRRFRQQGYLKVLWSWTKNGVKVLFTGKAEDEIWTTVR